MHAALSPRHHKMTIRPARETPALVRVEYRRVHNKPRATCLGKEGGEELGGGASINFIKRRYCRHTTSITHDTLTPPLLAKKLIPFSLCICTLPEQKANTTHHPYYTILPRVFCVQPANDHTAGPYVENVNDGDGGGDSLVAKLHSAAAVEFCFCS